MEILMGIFRIYSQLHYLLRSENSSKSVTFQFQKE
jgi:hypothetical protein